MDDDVNVCRHGYCHLHDAFTERSEPHIKVFMLQYESHSTHTDVLFKVSPLTTHRNQLDAILSQR